LAKTSTRSRRRICPRRRRAQLHGRIEQPLEKIALGDLELGLRERAELVPREQDDGPGFALPGERLRMLHVRGREHVPGLAAFESIAQQPGRAELGRDGMP